MGEPVSERRTCTWPRRKGSIDKCGMTASLYAQAPVGQSAPWGRDVCGIHANRAKNLGWQVGPRCPDCRERPGQVCYQDDGNWGDFWRECSTCKGSGLVEHIGSRDGAE